MFTRPRERPVWPCDILREQTRAEQQIDTAVQVAGLAVPHSPRADTGRRKSHTAVPPWPCKKPGIRLSDTMRFASHGQLGRPHGRATLPV
ncbi:unnamed protein product [Linum trigynum]|uniref:Uncharacterized protein n=1 Tax=Linum trigynum TaxID=586398 RepID=A0AAV2CPF2_9ROSI